ncbi:Uma2 family endonuclease [Megamonas hypermegale]|uniref:Uma2 family endonuclease n=1 Tax=Megamonas hypermegale TaxID=158847 RepID=UPI0026EB024B|nr:Uma2 family endonuclease [Megamonas hypermegale]
MDNLAYVDDFVLKRKREVIDGMVYMMSPRPRYEHVTVSGNIFIVFSNYLKGKTCRAFPDGLDLFLDEKNQFVPDVMIVCDKNKIKHNGVHGAPDLVVEVLSKTTAQNDKTKKKDAYERAGVKEYWLVDTWSKAVEVYLNDNGHFVLNHIYYYLTDEEIAENNALPDDDMNKIKKVDKEIKVSIFQDLVVKLEDVFEYIE